MGRLILVTGGSGSGKSAFAEQLLLGQCTGRAVYLATMENTGEESRKRILRHRAMRQGHGDEAGVHFFTMEQPVRIGEAPVKAGDYVLLEDMGNLLANEIWSPQGVGADDAPAAAIRGVLALKAQADLVVVVSNELGSDGGDYPAETLRYIEAMGQVNCRLAREAEAVVEVVCGIPLFHKGQPC